ncbi:LysR family transcriptional regulator [Variovorax sp. 770b2]|uniref:LysR family transcriptional regulator n=1 Tax=Variovorax sp. 770b2 TaxID=1566271 RepID=UPI00210CB59D|nr:LysR family transcriptional regulator [Variovorax sp. 770b2]
MNKPLSTMTFVQLRHFLSVAETGSFTRSAKALSITQPALSRSIHALEGGFQRALFDRVGRRSELTHFGRDMLERVRHLVCDADDLVAAARGQGSNTLRVGLGAGPGALLATPLLERMAYLDAPVRIDILRGDTDRLLQALRQRALDAVVVEFRAVTPSVDLRIEPLVEMRGAFMCRRGHPLARKRGPLSFQDLLAYPLTSTSLGRDVMRAMVDAYGPEAHPDQCVTLRCSEISNLVELTRNTDAVLLAVRAVAPDLVALPVHPPLSAARFGLVTLAGRSEAPTLPLLREVIAERMRSDEKALPRRSRTAA